LLPPSLVVDIVALLLAFLCHNQLAVTTCHFCNYYLYCWNCHMFPFCFYSAQLSLPCHCCFCLCHMLYCSFGHITSYWSCHCYLLLAAVMSTSQCLLIRTMMACIYTFHSCYQKTQYILCCCCEKLCLCYCCSICHDCWLLAAVVPIRMSVMKKVPLT